MGVLKVFGDSLGIIKLNPLMIIPYFILAFFVSFLASYSVVPILNPQAVITANVAIAFVISLILMIFVSPFFNGVYTIVANEYSEGKKISLLEGFKRFRQFYPRIIKLAIILTLITLPLIMLGLKVFSLVGILSWSATFLLFIIYLVFTLAFEILLFTVYPVLILENLGLRNGIKRSIEIGMENLWKIFAIILLSGILETLLGFAFGIPSGTFGIGSIIDSLIKAIPAALVNSLMVIVPVIFYRTYGKGKK